MDKVQLISADEELIAKLRQKFGNSFVYTSSIDDAVMNVSGGAIGTTIIEGIEKLSTLRRVVALLREACPSMALTCLAAPDNVSTILNSDLKPYIFRVLPNTISIGQILLAVKSSQHEHEALKIRERSGENLSVPVGYNSLPSPVRERANRGSRAVLLCLLLGSCVLTGLLFTRANMTAPPATVDSSQAVISAPTLSVDSGGVIEIEQESSETDTVEMAMLEFGSQQSQIPSLLREGVNAMLKNQLVDPYGDNAATYFRQVLVHEPDNQDALDGLEEVQNLLVQRINSALLADDKESATTDIVTLRSLNPAHPQVAVLSTKLIQTEVTSISATTPPQISNENRSTRPAVSGSAGQTNTRDIARSQAEELLAQIDERINATGFDAAISLINAPRPDLASFDALFNQRIITIRNVLVNSGENAIALQNIPAATESIRLLRRLGLNNEVNNLNQRLTVLNEALAADVFVPASAKNLATPNYPRSAIRRDIEGYVALSFIVRANGDIDDIQVTESVPASVFDAAAIEAMSASTFIPATRNGIPEDQRVIQKLNFQF